MKRDRIVSYDIAKTLFEKGFREKVNYMVYPDNTISTTNLLYDYNSADKSEDKIKTYSAPTLAEVSDWLMDNYNIFIELDYLIMSYNYNGKYKYMVIDTSNEDFGGNVLFRSENSFRTKENALLEAISKVVNKIKPLNINTENTLNEVSIEKNFFNELKRKEKIEVE